MSYSHGCPCCKPRTKSGFKGLDHMVPSDDKTAQKCKGKSSVIESSRRQLAECRTETRNADGVWYYCTLPYGHEGPHIFSARSPIDAEAAQQYAGSLGVNVSEIERVFTGYQPKDTQVKMGVPPNAGSSVNMPDPQSPNTWNRLLVNRGAGAQEMLDTAMKQIKDNPAIGPDAPLETLSTGSKQSALPYRFDLLDSKAMFRLAAIRYYGTDIRGYTPDNWRGISAESHVNHALSHLMAWLGGDKQDDHLGHAFCRLMFAVGVEEAGK